MPANLSDILKAIKVEDADCALVELGRKTILNLPRSPRSYCHIVLRGSAAVSSEDHPDGFVIRPGEAVILNHGNEHRIHTAAIGTSYDLDFFREPRHLDTPPVLSFGSGSGVKFISVALFRHQGQRASGSQIVPDVFHFSATSATTRLWGIPIADLDDLEAACHGSGAVAFLAALAYMLTIQAVRICLDSQRVATDSAPMAALQLPQIAMAWRLIQSSPGEDWTIARLAAKVGLSRSSFAEKFHHAVGETTMRYVARVRMERAAQLFREGTKSVSSVAHQAGYKSLSSFSREFKERFAMTPREYLRAHHQE